MIAASVEFFKNELFSSAIALYMHILCVKVWSHPSFISLSHLYSTRRQVTRNLALAQLYESNTQIAIQINP